jgi:inorganic pyrophosphatase/exopolyphosphatase
MVLVDHNILAPDQQFLTPYVENVIDHHFDEKVEFPALNSKTIEIVGSCSTLVAEKISNISPDKAYLLLMAILMDTSNLTNPLVTTKKDVCMANRLKLIAGELFSEFDYAEVSRLRSSVDHLRPDQLLRKDYKLYQEENVMYGIACIPKGVQWNLDNRHIWEEEAKKFQQQFQLDYFAILGFQPCGKARALLIHVPDSYAESFCDHLKRTPGLNQQLILQDTKDSFYFYHLKEPIGRKILQPLLVKCCSL